MEQCRSGGPRGHGRDSTTVHAKVNVGNSDVFGTTWDGVNNPSRTILDNDTDGVGHGHLILDLRVNAGTLEVTR